MSLHLSEGYFKTTLLYLIYNLNLAVMIQNISQINPLPTHPPPCLQTQGPTHTHTHTHTHTPMLDEDSSLLSFFLTHTHTHTHTQTNALFSPHTHTQVDNMLHCTR